MTNNHTKEPVKIKCKTCDFEAETQKEVDVHEWVTHINNYRCDKYDFTAENAVTITVHVKAMHQFKCDKCEYEVDNMKGPLLQNNQNHQRW